MTYGEIRFNLKKLLPGVDLDLVDRWILNRYTAILDRLNWKRREIRSVIQTFEPYETGTVALTAGSTTVTGTGTTWGSTHTGCGFRVPHRTEFYEFTYVSPTSGTLDRPYEGDTESGVAYKLFQSVYPLPADCRVLNRVTDLARGDVSEFDSGINYGEYGPPRHFVRRMDDLSATPRMQIELWPIPDGVYGLAIEYTAEEETFGSTTSTSLLPWLRPGCLLAGVEADGLYYLARQPGTPNPQPMFRAAEIAEGLHQSRLMDMIRTEALNKGARAIKVSQKFRHSVGNDLTEFRRRMMMP